MDSQNQKKQPQKKENSFVNQFMAEKAGMKAVDKAQIAKIIQKITQGTPKALYEKQMAQKRQYQLAQMLKKILQFSIQQKKSIKQDWNYKIQKLKESKDLSKYWAHLDFDMFYIACQLLDKPELKEKPCAVGGQFSVLCTANYQARKYGVRSALPTFIAKKLCPELVLINPNFTKYKKYSQIFRDILRKYDQNMESHGLDEAYIELTGQLKQKSKEEQQIFINNLRLTIFQATGLTVSCGVGANKMLAKIASQEKKPNSQFILQNDSFIIQEFMKNKPIRKIPGIGPVNQYFLKGLGIQKGQDILNNLDVLSICFSSNSNNFFVSAALGLGSIQHQFSQRKSLGKSQTFKPTNDLQFLKQKIFQICEQVSMQLQQQGYMTQNIVVTIQNAQFSKKDRTFNLPKFTFDKKEFIQTILSYVQDIKDTVRLVGIKCTNIMKIQELRKHQLDKYLNKTLNEPSVQSDEKIVNDKSTFFFCPVCNEEIQCKGNLASFNRHIDKCISKQCTQKTESNKKNEQKTQKSEKQKSTQKKQNKKASHETKENMLLNFLRKKQ